MKHPMDKQYTLNLMGSPRLDAHRRYLDTIETATGESRAALPNIVVIMMDDMGWGDMSAFGSRAIYTPNLDQLAASGITFTNGYASSPVCTPSRFGFLTGRYPSRGLITSVFFPSVPVPDDQIFDMRYDDDKVLSGEDTPVPPPRDIEALYTQINERQAVNGIPEDEITLAEGLQARGYKTALFGKWHLGDRSPSLPNDKGFGYFYGSHYSNDMLPYHFYRNRKVADRGVLDQRKITGMLTDEILRYIDENAANPFFIFYASPKPHHPIYAGERFQGTSKAGAYGDCIQEVDWSVGEIVRKLEEKGLAEKTLIVFTSDNGPWHQGSPGLHRGRKGNSFDGGQIVPVIASWPGSIPAGRSSAAQMMNIDFFPTFLAMAGVDLPADRVIDGKNLLPLLMGESGESPHEELFCVMNVKAYAVRHRDHFKYYATTTSDNAAYLGMGPLHPFLFDLNVDPNESYDQHAHHPERAKRMRDQLYAFNREMESNPRGWFD
jgi:arylsulfatase A